MQGTSRLLIVESNGSAWDAGTGELFPELTLEVLHAGSGVIAGKNLYPILAKLEESVRETTYWSMKVHAQVKRGSTPRGIIYMAHISYMKKIARTGASQRERRKWLVLNTELFTESLDIHAAAQALIDLANSRGIAPKYSPGAYGGALLRASPLWEEERRPAPSFISAVARDHLPGNYYALRPGYRRVSRAYELDQQSAHHTIAATVPLPHPHYLRRRGARLDEDTGEPLPARHTLSLDQLDGHVGMILAEVKCGQIPAKQSHLYPVWMRTPGIHTDWIWTPELRLLGDHVKVKRVITALTSVKGDPALSEYAYWAQDYLSTGPHPAVKPALLAAYGVLAIDPQPDFISHSVHGRAKHPRAELISLPLLPVVNRSTVKRSRVPAVQNVVARGIIEAEMNVRSIQLARRLESMGIPIVHIYADAVIAQVDQLPFLPDGWKVQALTNVSSPHPNQILSQEKIRLPGIPNGRREAYIRKDADGYHLREKEPDMISLQA